MMAKYNLYNKLCLKCDRFEHCKANQCCIKKLTKACVNYRQEKGSVGTVGSAERIAELEAQLKQVSEDYSDELAGFLKENEELHAQIPTIAEAKLIKLLLEKKYITYTEELLTKDLLKKMSFLLGESGTDLVAQNKSEAKLPRAFGEPKGTSQKTIMIEEADLLSFAEKSKEISKKEQEYLKKFFKKFWKQRGLLEVVSEKKEASNE